MLESLVRLRSAGCRMLDEWSSLPGGRPAVGVSQRNTDGQDWTETLVLIHAVNVQDLDMDLLQPLSYL
ncbi:Protein Ycf2 [Dissostichus eleginoides]|uniref:Protein Ycf2 n=1 Tax=Dissostichus eleginoides TaxID=100907 RepID=A0AAD9BS90_DISEL|nr:Protein Ycf2 [Dissostichus eleginoides]